MDDPANTMRVCSVCRTEKPATKEFFYAYGYLSGATLRAVCKPCYIKQQRERSIARRAARRVQP